MKYSSILIIFLISFTFMTLEPPLVHAERTVIDLSDFVWSIARDYDADWANDPIYVLPMDISSLPFNPPTWGWVITG